MDLSLASLSFCSTISFYAFPNMPFMIFDFLCVFAPMSGYIDQLRRMISTRCSTNFKPGSSLVLIFSNFLRIVYWFGNHFASYLLWQAVVTTVVHLLLCFFYFQYKDVTAKVASDMKMTIIRRILNLFEVDTTVEFFLTLGIALMSIISATIFFCFLVDFSIVAEFIGLISNLVDGLTTFPPFMAIVVRNDISCVTTLLILQFITATCLKAVLFLCRPVPWPFRAGLAIQAFLVFGITVQYIRINLAIRAAMRQEEEENEEAEEDSEEEYDY